MRTKICIVLLLVLSISGCASNEQASNDTATKTEVSTQLVLDKQILQAPRSAENMVLVYYDYAYDKDSYTLRTFDLATAEDTKIYETDDLFGLMGNDIIYDARTQTITNTDDGTIENIVTKERIDIKKANTGLSERQWTRTADGHLLEIGHIVSDMSNLMINQYDLQTGELIAQEQVPSQMQIITYDVYADLFLGINDDPSTEEYSHIFTSVQDGELVDVGTFDSNIDFYRHTNFNGEPISYRTIENDVVCYNLPSDCDGIRTKIDTFFTSTNVVRGNVIILDAIGDDVYFVGIIGERQKTGNDHVVGKVNVQTGEMTEYGVLHGITEINAQLQVKGV